MLVCSALDSHIYWQLSDQQYRSSGEVLGHGSDDPESAAEIAQATGFLERLQVHPEYVAAIAQAYPEPKEGAQG